MNKTVTQIKSISAILVLIFSSINIAQQIPELVTDRPDQTESAIIVPIDFFQIETGFLYQYQKLIDNNVSTENDNLILGSTLCRYGLNSFFEFRFGGEYFYSQSFINDKKSTLQGFQNIILGTKFQFRKDQKYLSNTAVIVQSVIPFGNIKLRPERFEPEIILCLAQNLPDDFSIGINFGARDNSQSNKTFFIYTVTLGKEISKRINVFIEIYGNSANGFSPNNYFDCGLTYLHTQIIQVDFSFGTSITKSVTDWFGGLGISIRFPK